MFQEYINNVISSSESTRGSVMIALRAKMRFYISVTIHEYIRARQKPTTRVFPRFDVSTGRARLLYSALRKFITLRFQHACYQPREERGGTTLGFRNFPARNNA